jgi:ribose transport system substrate-binding protein
MALEIDFICNTIDFIGSSLGRKSVKKLTLLALAGVAAIAFSATASLAADYKIGLSNGWVGSEWRTQMIEEAQAAAAAWKEKGHNVEVVVQSANVDVPGQIAHVRNFISEGVNAIIINPNSPTAFDPVLRRPRRRASW